VRAISAQADGKVLAGGNFTNIGGQTRNHIARLNGVTGLADSFDPNANSTRVNSIAVQADGKILAGGDFTTIGGQTRSLFARLSNDTAALQTLAVTPSTILWARSGSSSQLARTAFEYSTDNVTYTPLGAGTPAGGGSDWILTGLSFTSGQSFYIRARGYYSSGTENGSESIAELVRNVFLLPAPSTVVSRKLHGATPFDISLPLSGNTPGIECRSGGTTNDYQVVLTFPSSVTFANAAVTAGVGSVSGTNGNGMTTVAVDLTGVSNAQRITVTLFGVSDGINTGDIGVPMAILVGDTTGNGSVNATDVSQTKLKSGQPVDATNFRNDVNVSNSINATDVSTVKLKTGTALPP
jgi:hypothetical protein